MRRRRNYFWNIIILILLVIVGMEVFLPSWAENNILTIIEKETGGIEEINLKVRTFPAFKILFGRVDRVEVEGKGLIIEDLYLDSFFGEFTNVILQKEEILGDNTDLMIIIKEKSINNFISKHYPDLSQFQISLNPEQALLQGDIRFFETNINMQLTGKLDIIEFNKIAFRPENIKVERFSLGSALFQDLIKDMGFVFDLNRFNLPLKVEDVLISSGEIRLSGGRSKARVGS